ncbi:MAG TPA: DUF3106 domain-containing protein [Xanthomonadaceae bacterium]|nr:DUF3106 domain-containing protein [Xanthomonadaceae bacterium]
MRFEARARPVLLAALLCTGALAQSLPDSLQHAPAALRTQWQQREAQVAAMPPAQREALRRRLAVIDALPRALRAQARERWLAWRALPALQRAQVEAAGAAFAALPQAQRERLRAEFEALDGAHRRGWRLGPVLGAEYPKLQPLLAYVPAEQRQPLLQVLHAMTAPQLTDLGMLAQRTPPEARDELRRALLSTSLSNRAVWLRLRLDR